MVHVARVKVVLVGAPGSGKTNLANNLINPGFIPISDSTEGINFLHASSTLPSDEQHDFGPLLHRESDTSLSVSSIYQALLQRDPAVKTVDASLSTAAAQVRAQPSGESRPAEPSVRARQTLLADSRKDHNLHPSLIASMNSTLVDRLTESSVFVDLLDCGGALSFANIQAWAFNTDDNLFLVVYNSSVSLDTNVSQAFRKRGYRFPALPLDFTQGEYLSTWLSTLAMARRPDAAKPLVVLVGTHANNAAEQGVLERSRREATTLLQRFQHLPLECRGPFFLDNATPVDRRIAAFRRQVHAFIHDKVEFVPIPLSFLKAEWAVKRRLGGTSAELCVPLNTFHSFAVDEFGVYPEKVVDLLDYLHGNNVIRSFDHHNPAGNAYVYQSTAWFIAAINKVLITAKDPMFVHAFQSDVDYLRTMGILTDRLCRHIWADLSPAERHNFQMLMERFGLLCPVMNRDCYRIALDAGDLHFIPMCIQQPFGLRPWPRHVMSLIPVLLYYRDEFMPLPLYMRVVVELFQTFAHLARPDFGVRQVRFRCDATHLYYVEMSYTLRGIALAMFCTDRSAAKDDKLGVPNLGRMANKVLQETDRIVTKLRVESWQGLPDWLPAYPCQVHGGE